MAITISGTTGVAGVDGSASAPSVAGTDSNSGVYFGADTIKFSTGGTERLSITNAGVAGAGLFVSYAMICDQKDSTTDGGTFTSGAWRQRDLNTEIADPDSIVSISSNEFTLQAGTYLIKWAAPGYDCDRHVSRLYDVTNSAHRQYSWTSYASSAYSGENRSTGFCRVTISGATAYRIDHACQTTKTDYGLGLASETNASGAYSAGTTEGYSIYTVVEIYKEV